MGGPEFVIDIYWIVDERVPPKLISPKVSRIYSPLFEESIPEDMEC